MCGRFTRKEKMQHLAELLGLPVPPPKAPRFNIAPSQLVVCIRTNPETLDREWVTSSVFFQNHAAGQGVEAGGRCVGSHESSSKEILGVSNLVGGVHAVGSTKQNMINQWFTHGLNPPA